jgi:predicted helicase
MACGAGKIFMTLWINEKMKSKNTLVLLPSLNLLAQIVSEWSFASKSKIDVLCVFTDKSVGKKKENEAMQTLLEMPFPVHSDITEIRKFMKDAGNKFIFSA